MTSYETQILKAYEEGLTIPQISDQLGFEELAIKAKLMQLSAKYRKSVGAEDEEEDEYSFSKEQHRMAIKVIADLACSAENEKVRADMAKFIRDDAKGRKDVQKSLGYAGGNTFIQINEAIQAARLGAEKIKEKVLQGVSSKQLIET